jgi:hypothetical protein
MSTAQVALDIATASLGVSVISVAANVMTWARSGGRLRVRLTWTEHPQDRLKDAVRIEVHNVGRQSAVLRSVRLGKLVVARYYPNGQPLYGTEFGFDLFPTQTERSRAIAPTDFATFEVTFAEVRDRWGEQENLGLQACITRGDGKTRYSKVIRIRTPGQGS